MQALDQWKGYISEGKGRIKQNFISNPAIIQDRQIL
jgi:hypothetical protein